MGGGNIFAGEQFPTDLSAGALTVKEPTKALESYALPMRAQPRLMLLGVRLNIEVGGFPAVRALAAS